MKSCYSFQKSLTIFSVWLMAFGLLAPPAAYAAKPGGVANRLPPFVPIPAPVKTLQTVSPFAITGFIQAATLDPAAPTSVTDGGTLTVNGILITVPQNTLFQMPAFALTWQELFALAPSATVPASLGCGSAVLNPTALPCSTGPYGLTTPTGPQSGMAMADNPTPRTTYEVTVVGNRVFNGTSDKYIAALIFFSQQSLNAGQGYINFIDYSKGEMWVGPSPAPAALFGSLGQAVGTRVRINTPGGRYGIAQSADQRLTSDEDNPTIIATTGYPMCIPRFDPAVSDDSLCPQHNRPVDPGTLAFSTIFTMKAGPLTTPPGPALLPGDPDATQQAPFEINDFITFQGSIAQDNPLCVSTPAAPCTTYMSAHTITANLGIFTAANTMPAYVSIQSMLLGAGGTPNPLFPQEAVEKLRVEAFSTDSSQLVDSYGVDVNACGVSTNRFYMTADPFGPPIGLKGRARMRSTTGNFLPATREIRVASRTFTRGQPIDSVLPTAKTYANGLIAGQYHAPNFTFIFPENLVIGSPQVPTPFQEFPFLVNGTGPYFGAGSNNGAVSLGTIGQLNPWPGLTPPPANACNIPATVVKAPTANAGAAQTVSDGALVTLNGSGIDPNVPPLPLTFTWQQVAGTPAVVLSNNGIARPTFSYTLPVGVAQQVFQFSLVVSNGFASSAIATASVTVVGASVPIVTATANPQFPAPGSLVTLTSTVTGAGNIAPLTFRWTQTVGPAVVLTGANTATATFTAPIAIGPLQFLLTVTNGAGNVGTASAATIVPDTVTIASAVYVDASSKLQVSATSTSNGGANLTLHVPGFPDVAMFYDPTLNVYTVLADIVNPAPVTVSVTSSFGGTATSPITRVR